jgi:hypothetical protein
MEDILRFTLTTVRHKTIGLVVSISLVITQSAARVIASPNPKTQINYSNKANETKRP